MPGSADSTWSLEDYASRCGEIIGQSSWVRVDQEMIDRFAELTGDRQYIHVDPDRAGNGPFGGTIAHGFLLLSLLSQQGREALPRLEGMRTSVNCGFDRVRFVSPVRAGARIRASFRLDRFDRKSRDDIEIRLGVSVEIEGRTKPALVADWILRRYLNSVGTAVSMGETS